MHTLVRFLLPIAVFCCLSQLQAQEGYEKKIADLKEQRELVVTQEKQALKNEVTRIENQLAGIQAELAKEGSNRVYIHTAKPIDRPARTPFR